MSESRKQDRPGTADPVLRPRPQFRLSTLLWITLAVACWFGGMMAQRYRNEHWTEAEMQAAKDALDELRIAGPHRKPSTPLPASQRLSPNALPAHLPPPSPRSPTPIAQCIRFLFLHHVWLGTARWRRRPRQVRVLVRTTMRPGVGPSESMSVSSKAGVIGYSKWRVKSARCRIAW
jgi:hypothetical protein